MPNDVQHPSHLKFSAPPSLELVAFLNLWRDENYAGMARRLRVPMQAGQRKTAKEVRGEYQQKSLLDYHILGVRDTDAAASTVTALLSCAEQGELKVRRWQFRMVYLNAQHQPVPRDQSGGRWVPVTAAILPDPPAPETLKA